jgi:hypothetical protein
MTNDFVIVKALLQIQMLGWPITEGSSKESTYGSIKPFEGLTLCYLQFIKQVPKNLLLNGRQFLVL